jgi:D-threo-aldose 1-dehydrogenase
VRPLAARAAFGKTGLAIPPIIFGTSCLGNLYQALPWGTKLGIMSEWFEWVEAPVALDTAGKYGAGLALEVIGEGLREMGVPPDDVAISNKLGWLRVPLRTPEPTFEPGAWADLEHDAEQKISYEGILECHEQGCELLGGDYEPEIVSVHDPDEYLADADSGEEREKRFDDVVGAYRALGELKAAGRVKAVGIGSKDWRVIRELAATVDLDWVMFACSLTIMRHPPELLSFMANLESKGIAIINSAVFNAGFLTGGSYFDYRLVDPDDEADRELFQWRDGFFALCEQFDVLPAEACVQFGMSVPGVVSIALNTSKPDRVQQNVAAVQAKIPVEFWAAMKADGLVAEDYPCVG